MKSAFGSRRKARKVGQDDSLEAENGTESGGEQNGASSVVKKPQLKPKKKSGLRLSFGPGAAESEGASDGSIEVFTPKKSNLSRQAIEKNAIRKSLGRSLPAERLPIRAGDLDDRPSYSRDYLNELKSSTPSTPNDLSALSIDESDADEDALDVLGKFGERSSDLGGAAIPSQSEIQEKKERRARLAKEGEYIGLDGGDKGSSEDEEEDENGEIALRPRKKWTETRLVREDEDLGEGFDEFVEDGRITLGKKAEKEQSRRRRMEMKEMIQEAEGSSGEESDDSEAERRAAYDVAQTRAGTYNANQTSSSAQRPSRPKTPPPKITPLPSLTTALERLQTALTGLEATKAQKVRRMEELARERAEIAAREVEIQKLLTEAGQNYERLAAEAGGLGGVHDLSAVDVLSGSAGPLLFNRGLESFGNTPVALRPADDD
ncbi:MAG: hypothetical protein M1832_001756 [Thelocarpon impressellum]|nr:MAG: hypothetical protein M1832_001756 [Thelocarpon impressellum]